jgi:hypothetical protein
MKVKKIEGIEIKPEFAIGDVDLQSADQRIAEVLLTPQSELHGRSLKQANFRQYAGLTVLAIYRHGNPSATRSATRSCGWAICCSCKVRATASRRSAASRGSRYSAKSASRSTTRARGC